MNNLQIPSGWHKQTLGRIASIKIGKTPPRDHDEFWDVHKQSQNVWLSIRDMTSRYLSDSAEYITDKAIREFNIPAVEMGTILLSFKLTIGKVAIAQRELRTNEAIAAIKILDSDQTDNDFLSYGLSHWNLLQNVDQAIKGATLNKKKLREIEFTLPIDPAEQRAIADILSIVDEAIAQSESLVRKYQSIKQGLMSDLLTRGVAENGELRPSREEAPGLYREGNMGWLPKDWEAVELQTIATVERGKFTPRPRNNPKYYNGEHPFIQTGEVAAAGGRRISTYTQTLNELGASVSREFPKETIVVTIAANIGETAILDIPMYVTDSLVGIVVRQPNSVRYVEMFIRSKKEYFNAVAPQSAQKNINLGDLRPMLIAKPKPIEQDKIAEIYDFAESVLMNEENNLTKLQLLKQGLMQDLLSGQVRVKV